MPRWYEVSMIICGTLLSAAGTMYFLAKYSRKPWESWHDFFLCLGGGVTAAYIFLCIIGVLEPKAAILPPQNAIMGFIAIGIILFYVAHLRKKYK